MMKRTGKKRMRDISVALNGDASTDMSWEPTSYACPLASSTTLMWDEPAFKIAYDCLKLVTF